MKFVEREEGEIVTNIYNEAVTYQDSLTVFDQQGASDERELDQKNN